MRLTRTLAEQIVANLLALLSPIEDAPLWRGACLCLAELARRGLLLPKRLRAVVDRVEKATLYDKFMGTYSKGDQVRGSACCVMGVCARLRAVQRLWCASPRRCHYGARRVPPSRRTRVARATFRTAWPSTRRPTAGRSDSCSALTLW